MTGFHNHLIIENLKELSSKEEQRRLWLWDGGNDVSSFVEAVEGLFDDTGLGEELEKNRTGWPVELTQKFAELDKAIDQVDNKHPDDELIESPAMDKVRALAAETLALFLAIVVTPEEK